MQSLLNEYTITFFVLLKELRQIDAQEKLELISIISVPHTNKETAQKIIQTYMKLANPEKQSTIQNVQEDRQRLKNLLGIKKKYG